MRILITGALGHIGSKFIHNITNQDFEEIIMIDNLSTQRYSSLFNLPKNINYKFIEGDILKVDLTSLTKNIDVVIHLAAITDAPSSFKLKNKVEQVNFDGTKLLAQACIKNNTPLIFPSTTSVYGTQLEEVDETCSVEQLKPQSPYAEFKLKSEFMLSEMGSESGLNFINLRLGTIFGKSIGMRFHTAVNKFCWQSVMKKPLTVWSTAMDQKRPYLGVGDAINIFKFIIKKKLYNNNTYNIVSTNTTVRHIVDNIKELIPSTNVEYVDTEIMNQLSYNVSSQRIKNEGFVFNDNLKDGIIETINLLRS